MRCPTDGTELRAHRIHSIEVRACPECRGLWFDKDKLRRAKDAADPDLNWLDFDLWSDQGAFEIARSSRKCPECSQSMATILYGATELAIDACADRHGVWLDMGEFEGILQALQEEVNTKRLPDYVGASLEEAREILSGGEGFLSEWKDLLTVTRLLQLRVLAENPSVAEALAALQSTFPLR